jgi:hypothetical protein
MNDAEYAAAKKRVLAIAKKWQKALGLGWWDIEHEWVRGEIVPNSGECDLTVHACVHTHWEYGAAVISWPLQTLAALTDSEIERAVVHEFLHILVNEMNEPDGDGKHEERVVTGLTKAVFWLKGKG